MPPIYVTTLAERSDLMPLVEQAESEGFAEFLVNDPTWRDVMPEAMERYPECQIFVLDDEGEPLFVGNAVRISWDGVPEHLPAGTHAAMRASLECELEVATTLCAIQGVAIGDGRGTGRSEDLIRAFRQLADENGWRLVVPVRALLKDRYPLTPMTEYVSWKGADGQAFDPWLRMQDRVGGQRLQVCDDSLVIDAPLEDWERWTGMAFPASGRYVIEGGHEPLVIDAEAGTGHYSEAHVWYEFPPVTGEG